MIEMIRYTWRLLVLSALVMVLGILLLQYTSIPLPRTHFIAMLLAITAINLISFRLMLWGVLKSNREGVVFLLAGLGGKFLLYLIFILVFWLVTKNLTKAFIIGFFALYLLFTSFLASHLLKVLKNKQLQY